ncbi:chemotaxis protein CheW [Sulfuricurvum sp.]|uniref:chemotaxis protein CheW n=1 Tax=Sulfuricurvum sp. TaxID=2025608 RepID=UPI003BB55935
MSTYQHENSLQDWDDDDEIDLVKLVTSNANDANQYLIFEGSNNEFYAINIAKIEEILIYDILEIAKNTDHRHIIGTAQIRGHMTPLFIFDQWFGNPVLNSQEYELMIMATFGGHRIAMIVKRIEDIVVIEPHEMESTAQSNPNTSFIANIKIRGALHLCTIFDSDKMLLDLFHESSEQTLRSLEHITPRHLSNKIIFFADDSLFIRKMVEKLLSKMGTPYKIYENGAELIDALQQTPEEQIALVITDLEMPVMSGYTVISTLRNNPKYNAIHLIVHTNMSNSQMSESLLRQGVNRVIGKVNIEALESAIMEQIR